MITRTYTYNQKEYTITIKRQNLGIGTKFYDQGWIATAVDSCNERYANFTVRDSVLQFVAGRSNSEAEKFIVDIVENEVRIKVDGGLNQNM